MSRLPEQLVKNLTKEFPRSPHDTLGGYVVAARAVDKCRAVIAGTHGDYHFDCPLDNYFFRYAGISGDQLRAFLETGADDEATAKWIVDKSSNSPDAIKLWNMQMKYLRPVDLPNNLQLFLHDYIPQFIPADRRIYTWFDVYDIEEGRI